MTKFNESGSKYLREITPYLIDSKTDVYAVLKAFNVNCPARQHAIKKLLCTGIRGKGDVSQDLSEARDAIDRAIQLSGGLAKESTVAYMVKGDLQEFINSFENVADSDKEKAINHIAQNIIRPLAEDESNGVQVIGYFPLAKHLYDSGLRLTEEPVK